MTHYSLPNIDADMGKDQHELIITQATAHIVCCALNAEAQAGNPGGGIGFPDGEIPYENLHKLIGTVKNALRQ